MPKKGSGGVYVECECTAYVTNEERTCGCSLEFFIPAGQSIPAKPICSNCAAGSHE